MPLSACLSLAVGPPLLIPMYFQYQIIMTMIVHKNWVVSQGHSWLGMGRRVTGTGGPGDPTLPPRVPQWSLQGPMHLLPGVAASQERIPPRATRTQS